MADIALRSATAAQVVSVANEDRAIIYPHIAAAALTAGDAVYINSSGLVDKASSAASGTKQFRGIALETVGAGQGVSVLYDGLLEGYNIDALAYDALVFLSDTAGALSTTAGTATVQVGRVQARAVADSAGNIRKLLLVHSRVEANW